MEQRLLYPIFRRCSSLFRAAVRLAHFNGTRTKERCCRFSEIEALTVLALIVLHYKIEVLEEPQFVDESFEQRKERVLEAQIGGLTLTPKRVPLQLTRRK